MSTEGQPDFEPAFRDRLLSALSQNVPDLELARSLQVGVDWSTFVRDSNPVKAIFSSKAMGWDRGLDSIKCDPPIIQREGMETVISEVMRWCAAHHRQDLLASAWLQECGSEHLKACGHPTEERYPLIEAVHHGLEHCAWLCLDAGAHPYRVVSNAIG